MLIKDIKDLKKEKESLLNEIKSMDEIIQNTLDASQNINKLNKF